MLITCQGGSQPLCPAPVSMVAWSSKFDELLGVVARVCLGRTHWTCYCSGEAFIFTGVGSQTVGFLHLGSTSGFDLWASWRDSLSLLHGCNSYVRTRVGCRYYDQPDSIKNDLFLELTRGICSGETESSAFHSQARWCFCLTELIFHYKRLDGNKTSGLSFSISWDPSCVPKGCFARSHSHLSLFSWVWHSKPIEKLLLVQSLLIWRQLVVL